MELLPFLCYAMLCSEFDWSVHRSVGYCSRPLLETQAVAAWARVAYLVADSSAVVIGLGDKKLPCTAAYLALDH